MADNYIENQMEKYRSGQLAPKKTKTAARSRREGELTTRYAKLTVFVGDGTTELGKAVVKAFREIDALTVFSGADRKAGTALACESGGRYVPGDAEAGWANASTAGGKVDVTVVEDAEAPDGSENSGITFIVGTQTGPARNGEVRLERGTCDAGALARLIRFLSHPENRSLTAQSLPASE